MSLAGLKAGAVIIRNDTDRAQVHVWYPGTDHVVIKDTYSGEDWDEYSWDFIPGTICAAVALAEKHESYELTYALDGV